MHACNSFFPCVYVCTRDPSPTEMSVEPWPSPPDQAAAEQTQGTLHSTASSTSSEDLLDQRPDKLCLDAFWTEVETIRQGSAEADADRRDSKQSEVVAFNVFLWCFLSDGEQEEQWLADAGLSTLISEDGEDSEDVDKAALLSTLTRTQAEAVQRRIESYTLSLRKRNKPSPRDVRDIFHSPMSQVRTIKHSKLLLSVTLDQRGGPKDEIFITDVAYCEQAVILIKQAKLPQTTHQRRKEDGTLPRVVCPKCRLGVTRIQDLSQVDMKKVRQLALIDMTALSDLLELEVKRNKSGKRKIPESTLFGVPLAALLENDQKMKPYTSIPLFMQAVSHTLKIIFFFISNCDQRSLENTFYSGQFNWDEVSPNDAAALLKKFIRDLPAPLLTPEYLNTFSAVRDLKQKLHMLNLLVLLLPEPNRNTLKALLEFLSKVVSREKKNRMNLWAVATIMAPNLFLHKAVPSKLAEGSEKGQAEKAADVMRLLIRYQDLLWTVPNFLMSQVRRLNENSSRRYQFYDRRIKNLLRKIHTDSREKPEKNVPEVSEHCLDPDTHLQDLYNSNPGGEWVIRLKPNSKLV
uniref:Rho-GAP domain-containing protein n=1 Tax=Periophthalmus magnuspinnatus TaxID=409849 RepID=A0A3B3ZZA6_9GOBI